MVLLPYLIFISTFNLEYLSDHGFIPRQVSWLPELLSGAAVVLAVLHAAVRKRLMISAKYLLLFGFIGTLLASSIIINDVQPGTIFIGARTYFKYIPFFLLPVAYEYSQDQFKKQLFLLAALGFLQLPVAILQRFVIYADIGSGDVITGTLETSGVLTMIMVIYIAVVVGMYLRKKISLRITAVLLILYIGPAGLDETKVTVILLPMALGIPFLIMARIENNLRSLIPFAVVGSVVFMLFIGLYQGLYASRGDMQKGGIIGFLTDPAQLEHYLYGGAAESSNVKGIDREAPRISAAKKTEEKRASRADAIIVAWKVLSADWTKLLVGVGIGNVTDSYLGKNFSGKYAIYNLEYGAGQTDLSLMLWEIGLLGFLASVLLMFFVLQDALALARSTDLFGAFALGWAAVVVMLYVAMLYQNNVGFNAISYLFWFFSGHVVAARVRMVMQKRGSHFVRSRAQSGSGSVYG